MIRIYCNYGVNKGGNYVCQTACFHSKLLPHQVHFHISFERDDTSDYSFSLSVNHSMAYPFIVVERLKIEKRRDQNTFISSLNSKLYEESKFNTPVGKRVSYQHTFLYKLFCYWNKWNH